MKKICFKCKNIKFLLSFYKHPNMPDGHVNKCKKCNKIDNNLNRKSKVSYYIAYDKIRYRTDIDRLLKTKYKGMVERVKGVGKRTYGARGKEICSYEDFFKWYMNTKNVFDRLYKIWKLKDFDQRWAPSVDRIDNKKGYSVDNMQWLTLKDNCKKYTK